MTIQTVKASLRLKQTFIVFEHGCLALACIRTLVMYNLSKVEIVLILLDIKITTSNLPLRVMIGFSICVYVSLSMCVVALVPALFGDCHFRSSWVISHGLNAISDVFLASKV